MHQEREFIVEKRGNLLEGFVDIVLKHVRQLNVITGLRGLLGIIRKSRRLEGLKGNIKRFLAKVLRINWLSSQYQNLFNCLIMILLDLLLWFAVELLQLVILLLRMTCDDLILFISMTFFTNWVLYYLRSFLLLLILLLLDLIMLILLICMAIIPYLRRLPAVKKCKFMRHFIPNLNMLVSKFHGIQGIKQFQRMYLLNLK
ncbi:ORF3 [Brisavirus]|uniref:ORF3 n=1 Tax=Brisavirus TaxID=2732654 RepID=A0A8G0QGJ7_9VIRU|nr:ORF3 [Brisavirus]QYV43194.1 ORF3 [Brisavirus]QYV43197.1 ORF3 [Brisavirus]QYV43200.1 ORF3 [Brisavirus]QYV43203.1 ORF3 [Brisavirus]